MSVSLPIFIYTPFTLQCNSGLLFQPFSLPTFSCYDIFEQMLMTSLWIQHIYHLALYTEYKVHQNSLTTVSPTSAQGSACLFLLVKSALSLCTNCFVVSAISSSSWPEFIKLLRLPVNIDNTLNIKCWKLSLSSDAQNISRNHVRSFVYDVSQTVIKRMINVCTVINECS